eukprot:6205744-Pleurochrysis_carterae.AAC.2
MSLVGKGIESLESDVRTALHGAAVEATELRQRLREATQQAQAQAEQLKVAAAREAHMLAQYAAFVKHAQLWNLHLGKSDEKQHAVFARAAEPARAFVSPYLAAAAGIAGFGANGGGLISAAKTPRVDDLGSRLDDLGSRCDLSSAQIPTPRRRLFSDSLGVTEKEQRWWHERRMEALGEATDGRGADARAINDARAGLGTDVIRMRAMRSPGAGLPPRVAHVQSSAGGARRGSPHACLRTEAQPAVPRPLDAPRSRPGTVQGVHADGGGGGGDADDGTARAILSIASAVAALHQRFDTQGATRARYAILSFGGGPHLASCIFLEKFMPD